MIHQRERFIAHPQDVFDPVEKSKSNRKDGLEVLVPGSENPHFLLKEQTHIIAYHVLGSGGS